MRTVTVLATGGTIATRTDGGGKTVARATGAELVDRLGVQDVHIEVHDVFRVGSYLMTLDRMHQLAKCADRSLREEGATGLVVTHGTDTLEETALFLDLFLDQQYPVVLTGAQRPADAPDSDGPRNLTDAILVAARPESGGLGTLIVFDGSIFPALGTSKEQTLASSAFGSLHGGPLGWVHAGGVHILYRVRPQTRLDLSLFDASRARVDIVPCYPGADATAMHAFVEAGARGIVLEATGAGNANIAICEAVEELTNSGVVVATSTRVRRGPVAAIYGDGGGADLLSAGAIPTGLMRPSQARVLLASLLGVHGDPAAVREALSAYVAA